ncbi:MAG: hypothetical protein HYW63_05040 [Candidatus Levybacteria bacterium]|nr:hypothetical protein [Candidatus Levybacteria bacterium]
MFNFRTLELSLTISEDNRLFNLFRKLINKYISQIILLFLVFLSTFSFLIYYQNGLGLSYNDARSHLDIGRRVVEGLKPGLAQLGSVWLPLPHFLMIPTVWNDFMWHSGLSGAIQSMASFVATGAIVYMFLKKIGVSVLGRIIGVLIFALNLNILYLQSTAMTELLLIATMTAGVYFLMLWSKDEKITNLIFSAFFVMLSTLVRYDGWFLLAFAGLLIIIETFRKRGYKVTEGTIVLFGTLAGLGVVLWFLWNLAIFGDPLYFIYGPYSAHAQQTQLEEAGVLVTKGDILLSIKIYIYALLYNSNAFIAIMGAIGAFVFFIDKKIKTVVKIASTALLAPLAFNILALYLGHSVLFIQGLSGDTWFNVRYGVMLLPTFAIFIGYLVYKLAHLRYVLIGLTAFVLFFSFVNQDAVTIDDARVGSSQKNVSEVSGWLRSYAQGEGFILISAASHDAIIFSSGHPMKKFIHEGTGLYWDHATTAPDRWARWIVMRTNDTNDSTFKLISQTKAYKEGWYALVDSYPFADIYELKPEYSKNLNTKPVLGKQK